MRNVRSAINVLIVCHGSRDIVVVHTLSCDAVVSETLPCARGGSDVCGVRVLLLERLHLPCKLHYLAHVQYLCDFAKVCAK